ncbi:gigasin-6-like isoform X1 [Mytilus trossulus]|uniref:gigasin-6-like isoform X1 n=1 Tax=Mytilus trossulus TaxID=6551 RepID=UPI003007D3DB
MFRVLLLLYVFVACLSGQENVKIDKLLKETFDCKFKYNKTVGLTVSVVKSDKVLFVGGYGFVNIEKKTPVTGDTLFQIASLSKAFASVLLTKLIEEKTNYTLDTRLKKILPGKKIFYDSLRSDYATLRDLLSHKLGIPKHNEMRFDTELTRENVVGRLKYLKPEGIFRSSYMYNSLMYGVVTRLAEIIGKDTWENLVIKHIFKPLEMNTSTFASTADLENILLAKGYVEYYGELHPVEYNFTRQYGELCGSVCILTTANDISKWTRFFLNEGKLQDGTRLISEQAFIDITSPVNTIPYTYTHKYFSKPDIPVTNIQSNYALGWRTGYYRGNRMFVHTGSTWGYRAMLSWYPKADIGIFVAFTGNDPNYFYRLTLHNYIFDVYTGQVPYLNTSTICSYPEPWLKSDIPLVKPNYPKDRNTTRNKKEYIGTYKNQAYGKIKIGKHTEKNKLKLIYGYLTFELYPSETQDEFYGDTTGIATKLLDVSKFKFKFHNDQVTLKASTFQEQPTFIKRGQLNSGFHPMYTTSMNLPVLILSIYLTRF